MLRPAARGQGTQVCWRTDRGQDGREACGPAVLYTCPASCDSLQARGK